MDFVLNPNKMAPCCLGLTVKKNTRILKLKVPPPLALHNLNPKLHKLLASSFFQSIGFHLLSLAGHALDDHQDLADFKNAWVHRQKGISHKFLFIRVIIQMHTVEDWSDWSGSNTRRLQQRVCRQEISQNTRDKYTDLLFRNNYWALFLISRPVVPLPWHIMQPLPKMIQLNWCCCFSMIFVAVKGGNTWLLRDPTNPTQPLMLCVYPTSSLQVRHTFDLRRRKEWDINSLICSLFSFITSSRS